METILQPIFFYYYFPYNIHAHYEYVKFIFDTKMLKVFKICINIYEYLLWFVWKCIEVYFII